MASRLSRVLWRRQSAFPDDYGDDDYSYDDSDSKSFWWTPAGMAVRYAIVAILFGAVLLFLVGGYYSTQRRLRRGQQPRPMYRWMVRRRQPYYYDPSQQQPPYPTQQQQYAHYSDPNSQGYGMHGYPAPPPPYSNGEMPPPVYQPPEGGSKVMPDQNVEHVSRAGEPSSSVGVEQPPPAARP